MSAQNYIRNRWYEDIPLGEFHVFGSHTFSEKECIDFAQKYAPEYFHTSPEMAFDSPYRGLVVSEWHLVSIWMKLMVSYMERFSTGVRDGRRNGAGVKVMNMVWHYPVRPGHTLTYTYEIVEKIDSRVRDKWSILRSRNEAFNQNNELVFSFEVDILAERKPS